MDTNKKELAERMYRNLDLISMVILILMKTMMIL